MVCYNIPTSFNFSSSLFSGVFYHVPSPKGIDGDSDNFLAVGLRDGKVIYRYNLGAETAEIESKNPITVGEWHTVVIKRKGKEGSSTQDYMKIGRL